MYIASGHPKRMRIPVMLQAYTHIHINISEKLFFLNPFQSTIQSIKNDWLTQFYFVVFIILFLFIYVLTQSRNVLTMSWKISLNIVRTFWPKTPRCRKPMYPHLND